VDEVRDGDHLRGNAVLVEDGRIAAVGDAGVLEVSGVDEIDYAGGVLIPGLRDAHFHPVGYAAALQRPSFKAARDFADVCDVVRDALRERPPDSALTGLRLDDETLEEGRLPDRDVLDRAAPDHPVLLIRYCGHVAVANSAALRAAAIDPSTEDPRGGSFDRDHYGRPTGVLRETAVELVARAVDARTPPLLPADLVDAMTAAASLGLVGGGGIVAAGPSMWGVGGNELELACAAAAELPIDLALLVAARSPAELEAAAARIGEAGGRIRFLGLKLFSDGSLGGHTAAMLEPFADRPAERGTDRLEGAWALEMARAALALDGAVAVHAIGDAANHAVLDLMEILITEGADPSRLRIEHASVLTDADIARFGRLGVTASVQPAFLASENRWLERRLGPDRLRRTYPFRSLLDAGAPLCGGSDSPVEPLDPLLGIAAARDRCGVVADERLDGVEALRLFTDWAARSMGDRAAIEPGHPATFSVLDRDPVTAAPDGLRRTRVLATWVNGEPVEVPPGLRTWVE
jgi:predicted amidohydrolase YtcJ